MRIAHRSHPQTSPLPLTLLRVHAPGTRAPSPIPISAYGKTSFTRSYVITAINYTSVGLYVSSTIALENTLITKILPLRNTSPHAKPNAIKALNSRPSYKKTTPQIYADYSRHFTQRKHKPTLSSREECSEFEDLLF